MDLTEAQGKQLFGKYRLPVPQAHLAMSSDEAQRFAAQLEGSKVVLKAQVPFGHRKKLGGIRIAKKSDAARHTDRLLSKTLKGVPVESILVEQFVELAQEWYLAISLNRQERTFQLLFSKQGGIDIEDVPAKKIFSAPLPMSTEASLQLEKLLGNHSGHHEQLIELVKRLHTLLLEQDATLVEVNPLGLDSSGALWLLDSKISLDDAAAFRHPDRPVAQESEGPQKRASDIGAAFVSLDGDVGVVGNGAGLVMATLDLLAHNKLRPANFLDVGGGADQARMREALTIVSEQPGLQAIFINIFGGITRTDEIAMGIQAFVSQTTDQVPLIVRLVGTKADEARTILKQAGVVAHEDLEPALRALREEVARVGR